MTFEEYISNLFIVWSTHSSKKVKRINPRIALGDIQLSIALSPDTHWWAKLAGLAISEGHCRFQFFTFSFFESISRPKYPKIRVVLGSYFPYPSSGTKVPLVLFLSQQICLICRLNVKLLLYEK